MCQSKKIIQCLLSILVIAMLPIALVAQQDKNNKKPAVEHHAGKGLIMQFQTPATSDSLKAKDITLSAKNAKDFKGQTIRIITTPEGEHNVEIVHPDSAEAERRRAFDAFNGKEEKITVRKDIVNGYLRHRQQVDPLEGYELPLRIRTEALSGNRLKLIIENHTDKILTNLQIASNRIPTDWSIQPAEHKVETIPANGAGEFIFELKANSRIGAEQVGFQFRSDEFMTSWSARVALVSSEEANIPDEFELHGNYPNPFNPTTTISYGLPEAMHVKVEIYNISGQRVTMLVNHRQTPGVYNIVWDASRFASGTYLYKITAIGESGEFFLEDRKLTLIK